MTPVRPYHLTHTDGRRSIVVATSQAEAIRHADAGGSDDAGGRVVSDETRNAAIQWALATTDTLRGMEGKSETWTRTKQ